MEIYSVPVNTFWFNLCVASQKGCGTTINCLTEKKWCHLSLHSRLLLLLLSLVIAHYHQLSVIFFLLDFQSYHLKYVWSVYAGSTIHTQRLKTGENQIKLKSTHRIQWKPSYWHRTPLPWSSFRRVHGQGSCSNLQEFPPSCDEPAELKRPW